MTVWLSTSVTGLPKGAHSSGLEVHDVHKAWHEPTFPSLALHESHCSKPLVLPHAAHEVALSVEWTTCAIPSDALAEDTIAMKECE